MFAERGTQSWLGTDFNTCSVVLSICSLTSIKTYYCSELVNLYVHSSSLWFGMNLVVPVMQRQTTKPRPLQIKLLTQQRPSPATHLPWWKNLSSWAVLRFTVPTSGVPTSSMTSTRRSSVDSVPRPGTTEDQGGESVLCTRLHAHCNRRH